MPSNGNYWNINPNSATVRRREASAGTNARTATPALSCPQTYAQASSNNSTSDSATDTSTTTSTQPLSQIFSLQVQQPPWVPGIFSPQLRQSQVTQSLEEFKEETKEEAQEEQKKESLEDIKEETKKEANKEQKKEASTTNINIMSASAGAPTPAQPPAGSAPAPALPPAQPLALPA